MINDMCRLIKVLRNINNQFSHKLLPDKKFVEQEEKILLFKRDYNELLKTIQCVQDDTAPTVQDLKNISKSLVPLAAHVSDIYYLLQPMIVAYSRMLDQEDDEYHLRS